MSNRLRTAINRGTFVSVIQKHHQKTGQLTQGIVQEILTNSQNHPRGIKVRLENGIVGRVQQINPQSESGRQSERRSRREFENDAKEVENDSKRNDMSSTKPTLLSDFISFGEVTKWRCGRCTLDNVGGDECAACGENRTIECTRCTFLNIASVQFCEMCNSKLENS